MMGPNTQFLHLATVSSLLTLLAASAIPDTSFSDPLGSRIEQRDNPPWPYGVCGDSWGSGVSYKDEVLYDGNRDKCLRTIESHGPQLEADSTWRGDYSSGLRDAACSGSKLDDLIGSSYSSNRPQRRYLLLTPQSA